MLFQFFCVAAAAATTTSPWWGSIFRIDWQKVIPRFFLGQFPNQHVISWIIFINYAWHYFSGSPPLPPPRKNSPRPTSRWPGDDDCLCRPRHGAGRQHKLLPWISDFPLSEPPTALVKVVLCRETKWNRGHVSCISFSLLSLLLSMAGWLAGVGGVVGGQMENLNRPSSRP